MIDHGETVLMTASDTPAAEREVVATRTSVEQQDNGTSWVVVDEWNDGTPLEAFTDEKQATEFAALCWAEVHISVTPLPAGGVILW